MKILIAVDGSEYTRRMLDFIAAHDAWFGPHSSYTVLHCVPPLPHRAAAFVDKDKARAIYDADAEAVFKPIRSFCRRHRLAATFVHRIGAPGPTIASFAQRQNADLIVLGSHGHGAVAGLVLGSVAAKVMALTRTPVLLVR